jgi:hypothetical protein
MFGICFRNRLRGMAIVSFAATTACVSDGAARVEPLMAGMDAGGETRDACIVAQPGAGRGKVDLSGRPGSINLDCYKFIGGEQLAYIEARADDQPSQTARRRLAAVLLNQSDAICTSEKGRMFKRQAEINGYLSIATTGLSTVSSIVSGELAKSILSGGAAFTSASRDHINTYAFYNQMIPTLTKAMDDARQQKAKDINGLLEHGNYTVDQMIRDVNLYHQLCSFTSAMQIVLDAVNNREKAQQILKMNEIDTALITLRAQANAQGEDQSRMEGLRSNIARLEKAKVDQLIGPVSTDEGEVKPESDVDPE